MPRTYSVSSLYSLSRVQAAGEASEVGLDAGFLQGGHEGNEASGTTEKTARKLYIWILAQNF